MAAAALLAGAAQPSLAVDDLTSGTRVGLRFGYVGTSDGLRDAQGDGWDATLYFQEKIFDGSIPRLFLDIRVAAIYLGGSSLTEVDDEITGVPGIESNMRFIYFSAGPMLGFPIAGAYSGYASAAVGVYSVSLLFQSAVAAWDFSDQHLGACGGIGFSRRIATSWCVELNSTVHWFDVDRDNRDLYHLFTDGADSPLLIGIAVGATLDLR